MLWQHGGRLWPSHAVGGSTLTVVVVGHCAVYEVSGPAPTDRRHSSVCPTTTSTTHSPSLCLNTHHRFLFSAYCSSSEVSLLHPVLSFVDAEDRPPSNHLVVHSLTTWVIVCRISNVDPFDTGIIDLVQYCPVLDKVCFTHETICPPDVSTTGCCMGWSITYPWWSNCIFSCHWLIWNRRLPSKCSDIFTMLPVMKHPNW